MQFERDTEGTIRIVGDLNSSTAEEFAEDLQMLTQNDNGPLTLDLLNLDCDDGIALATCVRVLRELRARRSRVLLRGASQMLAHNLYRVGALEGSRAIELVDTRVDEPTSS
jgi:anti-anti-sigma regulatory factor